MRLTKALREELALKLTSKAFLGQLELIAKRLTLLNEKFWEQHAEAMVKYTGMERWKLAEAISNQVLQVAQGGILTYGTDNTAIAAEGITPERRGVYAAVVDENMTLSGLSAYLTYYARRQHLAFRAVPGSYDLPNFRGMFNFTLTSGPIPSELKLAMQSLSKTIADMTEFHEDIMKVLQTFQTQKRLQEGFPEAAELIPPKQQAGQLVPVEMIESVRARLNNPPPAKISRKA